MAGVSNHRQFNAMRAHDDEHAWFCDGLTPTSDEQLPAFLDGLRDACHAGDQSRLQRLASRIRSQSDAAGFQAVSASARQVEQAVLAAECGIADLVEQVEALILQCQQAAKSGLQSESPTGEHDTAGQ